MTDFDWDEEGEYDEDDYEPDDYDDDERPFENEFGEDVIDWGSDQEQLGGLPADDLDLSDIPF